jgi:hypothetical protein
VGKTILDEIDMLALYAYSDSSESKGRATWRGFLSFIISNVLSVESDTADEFISASILSAPEQLVDAQTSSTVQAIHMVSADLAASLGMMQEFGLAALLEFTPPTKATSMGRAKEHFTEDELIALWLKAYENRVADPAFQALMESWKEMLEMSLAKEMTVEDNEVPEEIVQEEESSSKKNRKKSRKIS